MKVLYAGSFDPPTLGHLDIIARAAALFDELVVGVGPNPHKRSLLGDERRVALLREACADIAGVTVIGYAGATVLYAREQGVDALVRGLRDQHDFLHESQLAQVNRDHGIESIFLPCDPALVNCSSSMVRDVLAAGLDPSPYVPPCVARALAERDGGAGPEGER